MNIISTPNAPAAIGPYSQGYEAGSFVYTSGQIPVDPVSGNIPEGIVDGDFGRTCHTVQDGDQHSTGQSSFGREDIGLGAVHELVVIYILNSLPVPLILGHVGEG